MIFVGRNYFLNLVESKHETLRKSQLVRDEHADVLIFPVILALMAKKHEQRTFTDAVFIQNRMKRREYLTLVSFCVILSLECLMQLLSLHFGGELNERNKFTLTDYRNSP